MSEEKIKIVAINGKAQSGKSTMAKILVHEFGYKEFSFAEPIRKFVSEVCGFRSLEDLEFSKTVPQEILNGQTPRFAMQTLGTEWGRNLINVQIWTMLVRNKIKACMEEGNFRFVISDLRFDSEIDDIMSFFSYEDVTVYCIDRGENNLSSTEQQHASENSFTIKPEYVRIRNTGTYEEYVNTIRNLFS